MLFTANKINAVTRIKSIAKRLDEKYIDTNDLPELLDSISVKTKAELIDYNERHRSQLISKGILFSETSGTTGQPTLTPRGQEDLDWNVNNQMLVYKKHLQAGVDRLAIIHPGVLSPFVEASALALKQLGVGFVRIYPVPKVCDYQRMLAVLRRNDITAIMTTPSLVYKFLYEVRKINGGFDNFPVTKFLLTGEHISFENAQNLKAIAGKNTTVLPFVYGSSEVATVMYGLNDCTYKGLNEDFIFELVDPDTNKQLTPVEGQTVYEGKLVVSWLRDGLLPILRYDTNDIFRVDITDDDPIWHSKGRKNARCPAGFDETLIDQVIYQSDLDIYHFTCEINDKDITLNLICDPDETDSDHRKTLEDKIKSTLDGNFNIEVTINPKEHVFFDFSPSPKMSKFYYK